ncbi:MAG: hypothetical protein ABIP13_06230 [Tepidiformaceae bacterium]
MASMAAAIAWLGLLIGLGAGLSYWEEEGYAELPPPGEALTLTGIAGDEIKLKLRLPLDAEPNQNEWAASFRDLDSDFTRVLPLEVERRVDQGGVPTGFYGRFTVPEVPGRARARLEGTLEGSYRIRGGGQERIEIPLRLAIARSKDGGSTSGTLDKSFAEGLRITGTVFLICVIGMAFLGILVLGAAYLVLLVAGAVRSVRRAVRP